MYAIFVTGGKQYRAEVGSEIFVEKLEVEAEQEVVFDQVLLVGDKVGQPYVEGAKVVGVVKNTVKLEKLSFINTTLRKITIKSKDIVKHIQKW